MQAWKLRGPSPKLRDKIFNAPALATPVERPQWRLTDAMRWFVPVAGCLALLLAGLNSRNPGGNLMLASTNMMLGVYSTGTSHTTPSFNGGFVQCEQNNVPSQKLEWSVSNQSPATVPQTIFVSDTNHLIH